jgi:hypothetical protein
VNAAPSTAPTLERFQQLLFTPEDQSVYAILDGASVPDLQERLAAAKEDHCCLFRGELEPDLAEVAPYLVKLRRDSPFTQSVFAEGWGNHWGIFVVTPVGLEALRRHFRRFLRVRDHTGQVLYFRYYDPRVMRIYLPTCNRNEIKAIYGPISRFIAEDEATAQAVVFPCDSLRIKPVTQPLN